MRLYYTGASPDNLRQAREHAPSHSHGFGWTPGKMTPHDYPYFLDNGAYTGDFDACEWVDTVVEALFDMPTAPDFVVLPDVYGDAEATIARHERFLANDHDCEQGVPPVGELRMYWVLQPGVPLEEQFDVIQPRIDGVFIGGPKRWKRAHGREIVDRAEDRGLRTHVGNPGGADGLVWAYRCGFDSLDTTSIFQNGYWHYLDRLERATGETGGVEAGVIGRQSSLQGV